MLIVIGQFESKYNKEYKLAPVDQKPAEIPQQDPARPARGNHLHVAGEVGLGDHLRAGADLQTLATVVDECQGLAQASSE